MSRTFHFPKTVLDSTAVSWNQKPEKRKLSCEQRITRPPPALAMGRIGDSSRRVRASSIKKLFLVQCFVCCNVSLKLFSYRSLSWCQSDAVWCRLHWRLSRLDLFGWLDSSPLGWASPLIFRRDYQKRIGGRFTETSARRPDDQVKQPLKLNNTLDDFI